MLKKIISFLFIFFISFEFLYASEVNLTSEKYILYNMNDNEVILSQNENKRTSIASLTKIMTVIVSIENIKDFNKKVKITSDMIQDIAWDVATAGFKVGETLTYNDLLYGAILPSGADAVNALAISISGNKKDFVKLMNKKVKELGLKNTHFANVVGLYDENNYSSAYDMAEILKYSLNNSKFKEVFSAKKYTFSNGKTTKSTIERYNSKSNTNISYITGAKTGYIKKAGYCLATTATLNNVDFLLVTLNAFSNEAGVHIKDHAKAYTYFDKNYSYKNIVDNSDIIVTLKTEYSKEKSIEVPANNKIDEYLKNDFDKSKVKYEYDGIDTVSYFTKKGTKLGHVKIKYDNKVLGEFDLIYNQVLTFSLLSYIWMKKWIILIFVILFLLITRIIYVQIKRFKRKRRRKRKLKKLENS